jgi:hypothetical protein
MNLNSIALALAFAGCSSCHAGSAVIGPKPYSIGGSPNVLPATRYLAFQIFTWSPDPRIAGFRLEGTTLPGKGPLLPYVQNIKSRVGMVGDSRSRLAFFLGPIGCFDQSDAEVASFIKMGFDLALETNVAVGFKIDDSMFWANRKDLWSNPKNVEALDWEGTPSTGRRLDWGKTPTQAPPQMCFNSVIIQQEVRHRSAIFGAAVAVGMRRLEGLHRPELFAGVIAGSETMIGQDFATGRYLGYRALMNRGFSREHPPKDMDHELEEVVNEFIDLWTNGLAKAGVPSEKIYSHTAFVSHRVFNLGDHQDLTYSKYNHFAPPSVAFGTHHLPGFSTYPQPGLFDDIYGQLTEHKQTAWASCEGTNLQLGAGPGQSGMNMETYLAKMFNHGATLVDVFSWGIGGEANRNNEFRQVTENEEALSAYRKFLRGEPLVDVKMETQTLLERLPAKIRRLQGELPGWIQKTGRQAEVQPLVAALESALQAKDFDKAERTVDTILKMMGDSAPSSDQPLTDDVRRKLRHEFGFSFLVYRDKIQAELNLSAQQKDALDTYLGEVAPAYMAYLQTTAAREADFDSVRSKALANLDSELKKTLIDPQRKRLGELVRQREGLFGGPALWAGLQVTDEQKARFMVVIEPMHKKMEAAVAGVRDGANPADVQRHVLSLRAELETQLEGVLTDFQRKQWKGMLGKPMPIDALFDLSGG